MNESVVPHRQGLLDDLRHASAFPNVNPDEKVVVHETHISWVFLVGAYAYKVKKPVKTGFLDYSTLQKRRKYCLEELRLDSRFAEGLYLDVVAITRDHGKFRVEAGGEPVEYAVKMRRFPDSALLSESLRSKRLTTAQLQRLARNIARFHSDAPQLPKNSPWGRTEGVLRDAVANLDDLETAAAGEELRTLHTLKKWTIDFFAEHQALFQQRVADGFVRECHGDLHLANIVHWNGELTPFDGIEFNEAYRWIDVMSDAAFLAMDFAARGHLELSRSFCNSYLQETGDYRSLPLLRWYLVYRSLVRAKVASLRADQACVGSPECDADRADCNEHIHLAHRFSLRDEPCLWITHGPSGSGKTTLSELIVQRRGAIRLRSDIERKRQHDLPIHDHPNEDVKRRIYSESSSAATYALLKTLSKSVLRAGYSVVVDATFLKRHERLLFQTLAQSEGVRFAILDCHADTPTLRQRISDRRRRGDDTSDADEKVLDRQLASRDPLDQLESSYVVNIPESAVATESS